MRIREIVRELFVVGAAAAPLQLVSKTIEQFDVHGNLVLRVEVSPGSGSQGIIKNVYDSNGRLVLTTTEQSNGGESTRVITPTIPWAA